MKKTIPDRQRPLRRGAPVPSSNRLSAKFRLPRTIPLGAIRAPSDLRRVPCDPAGRLPQWRSQALPSIGRWEGSFRWLLFPAEEAPERFDCEGPRVWYQTTNYPEGDTAALHLADA